MNENCVALCTMPTGARARVTDLKSNGAIRRRLLDLGLTNGTVVEVLFKSPAENPVAYNIRGAVMAIRNEDAEAVIVQRV